MKNRTFTIVAFYSILILLLLSVCAQAQHIQYSMPAFGLQGKMFATDHKHNTAKITNSQSRIISECDLIYSDTSFIPADSVFYAYSGNRGGDINSLIKFDSFISYNYLNGIYTNIARQIQTFDANNNGISILTQSWDTPTSSYINSNIYTITYDNNNNQLTTVLQNWNGTTNSWINADSSKYIYDGNNNVTAESFYTWSVSTDAWVAHNKTVLTYTGININSGVNQSWNVSAWINVDQSLFTYDNNNNELSDLYQTWDAVNSSWTNTSLDLFTYDAGNNMLTDLSENWTSGNWANVSLYTYSNFIDRLPEIAIYQHRDAIDTAWVNSYEELNSYNNYDELIVATSKTWNGSAWQLTNNDRQSRYYYETYNLAVKPISTSGGTAKIYPIPAQDILHIDLTWDDPQACNIAIYDIRGRMLKQWQVPTTTAYHNAVSLGDMAAGSYFINITGAKGRIVQKLIVSR